MVAPHSPMRRLGAGLIAVDGVTVAVNGSSTVQLRTESACVPIIGSSAVSGSNVR